MYQDSWEIEGLLGPGQSGYLFALTGPDKILAYVAVLTEEQARRYVRNEELVPDHGSWIAASPELAGCLLHLKIEHGEAKATMRDATLAALDGDAALLARIEGAVVFQARQDWDTWSTVAPVFGEA